MSDGYKKTDRPINIGDWLHKHTKNSFYGSPLYQLMLEILVAVGWSILGCIIINTCWLSKLCTQ